MRMDKLFTNEIIILFKMHCTIYGIKADNEELFFFLML